MYGKHVEIVDILLNDYKNRNLDKYNITKLNMRSVYGNPNGTALFNT